MSAGKPPVTGMRSGGGRSHPPEPGADPSPPPAVVSADRKKSFGERVDAHAKRWQTIASLIVAVGVIVGFVGFKAGWHWPEWLVSSGSIGAEPSPSSSTNLANPPVGRQDIVTELRARDGSWTSALALGPDDPLDVVPVRVTYQNVTGIDAYHVEISIVADVGLSLGEVTLSKPGRQALPQLQDGMFVDIGDYGPGAKAELVTSVALTPNEAIRNPRAPYAFPCNATTTRFVRSFLRFNEASQYIWGPQASFTITRGSCLK